MTARDLLQHPFIRSARSTAHLTSLIERHRLFRQQQGRIKSTPSRTLARQAMGSSGLTISGSSTMRSEWNFDETIRGTVKGVPLNLDLAGLSLESDEEWEAGSGADEDEDEDEIPWESVRVQVDRQAEGASQRSFNVSLTLGSEQPFSLPVSGVRDLVAFARVFFCCSPHSTAQQLAGHTRI